MTPYYERDGIVIYHGDCREIVGAVSFGAIVTDPPYGVDYASNWSKETRTHSNSIAGDKNIDLRNFVLSLHAPKAVFSTARCDLPKGQTAILVWDKGDASGMGDLSIPWKPSFELIHVYGRGWSGRRSGSVLSGPTMVTSSALGRVHPHQKPVWLLQEIVGKAPAGVILDPFMGSGTTLVAAKKLNRRAIGIEIEERYCEIAAKRLDATPRNMFADAREMAG